MQDEFKVVHSEKKFLMKVIVEQQRQADKWHTSAKQHGEISIEFDCIDAVAMPIKDNTGEFELNKSC